MSKFLIFGGWGKLGSALAEHIMCLPGHFCVRIGHRDGDVRDPAKVSAAMANHGPDVVINCAALLTLRSEEDHLAAWETNALGAGNVSAGARDWMCRMVQVSTDYVFSGDDGGEYREEDPPDPINYYGFAKAAGEVAVLAANPRALVLRAPFRYDGPWGHKDAFADQWTSCRWMREVVPDIVRASFTPASGILHVGGRRRPLMEMAREVSPNVGWLTRSEFTKVAIPRDVSLSSAKWEAMDAES